MLHKMLHLVKLLGCFVFYLKSVAVLSMIYCKLQCDQYGHKNMPAGF